jgi:hypothetical protein
MTDIDVHYDPITVVNDPITVAVSGLNDINCTTELSIPAPIQTKGTVEFDSTSTVKTENKATVTTDSKLTTDGKIEVVVPEPVAVETSAIIDVKPVALDQCLTLRIDELPKTLVHQPYQHRFGLSFFGIEVLGLSLRGQWETYVNEKKGNAFVAWGGADVKSENRGSHGPAESRGEVRIRLGS